MPFEIRNKYLYIFMVYSMMILWVCFFGTLSFVQSYDDSRVY